VIAARVIQERNIAIGRVVAPANVILERPGTNSRVVVSGSVTYKGAVSVGSVGLASIVPQCNPPPTSVEIAVACVIACRYLAPTRCRA
jgi:hypothetical protein